MRGAVAFPVRHSVFGSEGLGVETIPAVIGHGLDLRARHAEDASVRGHPEDALWGLADKVNGTVRQAILRSYGRKMPPSKRAMPPPEVEIQMVPSSVWSMSRTLL